MNRNNDEFNIFNENSQINEFNSVGDEFRQISEFEPQNKELLSVSEVGSLNSSPKKKKTDSNALTKKLTSSFKVTSTVAMVGAITVTGTVVTGFIDNNEPPLDPSMEVIEYVINEDSISLDVAIANLNEKYDYNVVLYNDLERYVEDEINEQTSKILFENLNSNTIYKLDFIDVTNDKIYYNNTYQTLIKYTESVAILEEDVTKNTIAWHLSFIDLNPNSEYGLRLYNDDSNYELNVEPDNPMYQFMDLIPNTVYNFEFFNKTTGKVCYQDTYQTLEENRLEVKNIFVNSGTNLPTDEVSKIIVHFDKYLEPDTILNTYLIKDNVTVLEQLDITLERIAFENIEENVNYQVKYEMIQNDLVIQTETFDVSTVDLLIEETFNINYTNPGDVTITYNDDNTYNAYIYTNPEIITNNFDSVVLDISFTGFEYFEETGETIEHYSYYTGLDKVVVLENIPMNMTYSMIYTVYGIKDNVGYILNHVYPSGTITGYTYFGDVMFEVDRINHNVNLIYYSEFKSDIHVTNHLNDGTKEEILIPIDSVHPYDNGYIATFNINDYTGYVYTFSCMTTVEPYLGLYFNEIKENVNIKGITTTTLIVDEIPAEAIDDIKYISDNYDATTQTLTIDFVEYGIYNTTLSIEIYGDNNLINEAHQVVLDWADLTTDEGEYITRYTLEGIDLSSYQNVSIKYILKTEDNTNRIVYEQQLKLTN